MFGERFPPPDRATLLRLADELEQALDRTERAPVVALTKQLEQIGFAWWKVNWDKSYPERQIARAIETVQNGAFDARTLQQCVKALRKKAAELPPARTA